MANRFGAFGNNTLASAADTALTVASNASIVNRNYVYEFIWGDEGTPADNVVLCTVQRCTALGTNTAVTSSKLDEADHVANALCGENHTGEPTYTSSEELAEFPLNTRALFRWVAAPGGELVTEAVAASGIGWNTLHASATTDYGIQAYWHE